jgi:hypothetical protein
MLSIDWLYGALARLRGLSGRTKEAVMADNKIQGEGDYISGKKYQEMQKAREAEEALDGPEGAELEEARRRTAEGQTD